MNHYTGNITPGKDIIFVFGSNPEGKHGAGSARSSVPSTAKATVFTGNRML